MEKATEKWVETGLLYGLTGESMNKTAEGFEQLSKLCMEDSKNLGDPVWTVMFDTILPLYRRFVSENFYPNPFKLYTHYRQWLTLNQTTATSDDRELELMQEYRKQAKMQIDVIL
jgi:hypothetical protein